MKVTLTIVGFVLGVATLLCLVVFFANRFRRAAALESVRVVGERGDVGRAGDSLSVLTWNIGYAGMGAEADFVMDGGSQKRPASRELVERNLKEIGSFLGSNEADIYLFQEVARSSWNNHGVDCLPSITKELTGFGWTYGADIDTVLVPGPLGIRIGNACFSRFKITGAERLPLPLEPTFEIGAFRKCYRMHVTRLVSVVAEWEWVVVNIHLSAFDEGKSVRRQQIAKVMEFARAEFAKGNRVVVGGDWNLRLVATEFPHKTEEKHLFWIGDLPDGVIDPGWNWAVDARTPTVRTAHKPYVAGDNYVLIIDGFLCSPNIEIVDLRTTDLQFRNTDHHPVRATLKSRALPAN